jgi:hypothetical membrane protein
MLARIGNLCGVLAPLLWAAVILIAGGLRPGFSHYAQYISELGERGSTTELLMRYGAFIPTGLMHMGFAALLYARFRGNRYAALAAALVALNGLGRIGAGMFPCEVGCAGPHVLLSQKMHRVSAAVGFLAIIGAAVLWGRIFKALESLRGLHVYSIASGALGLVFLMLMSWSGESRAGTGLYERLSSGVLSLWVFVVALRLHVTSAADAVRRVSF